MKQKFKLVVWVFSLLVLGPPAMLGIICASAIQQITCWAMNIKKKGGLL